MADAALIKHFVETVYGDASGRVSVWWRDTPGSRQPYNKKAWFAYPEQTDAMVKFIDGVSGKDVCITTTTYDVDRRIPEQARFTNVVWMDSDTCEGSNYRISPSWTTVTSPGRWQHFWRLSEPADAMRVSALVHRIAIAHDQNGADQSSWPANKIMRVPDTMNTSHGFPTLVRAHDEGTIYSIEELESAYDDVVIPERATMREIPELSVDELPLYSNVLSKLNDDLLELATTEPRADQDRSRLRYKLLLELFRAGLSYEETLSVAWHAPAAKKWSEEDPRGLGGLAAEAMKAAVEAGTPSPDPADPFARGTDESEELAIDKPVVILSDAERESIKGGNTFIEKYIRFATERLPHQNRAYDRLNAWMILSLAYMDSGYDPQGYRKGRLNLFGCVLGETTSGKSTSFALQKSVTTELFSQDPEFHLGGNASETALVKALHARDGKVSYFNSDEASGVLKTWVGQDWTAGMRERITELYDAGQVSPLLRSTKNEQVLKSSTTFFNVFLQGTQRGIMPFLTDELFRDGFIPRFIFAIGEPARTDFNSYKRKRQVTTHVGGFDPVARQLAAELQANANAVREINGGECPIEISDEADDRIARAAHELDHEFEKSPSWDLIKPSLQRWVDNVQKAARLLAMDRRSDTVSMEDALRALEAGEEWFTNMLRIISGLNANKFETACADISSFVDQRGGRIGKAALYKQFKRYTPFEMTGFLQSLQNQGRVWLNPQKEGGREYFYSTAWQKDDK